MNTSTEMFGVIYFLFGTRVNIFVRKCDIGLDSVPFSGHMCTYSCCTHRLVCM